jgi:predicted nucleotidyltransferase
MLADLLGSATRAKVLTALLAPPRQAVDLRELIRRCGTGSSGVQREVARLERIGLVRSDRDDTGRRMIALADGHPLLAGIEELVAGEAAAVDVYPSPASVPETKRVAARIHPRLRRRLPRIVAACRRAQVERAMLFGSAIDVDAADAPNDLDVVVRLGGPVEGRAARYFTLRFELEQASGLSVGLVDDEALTNPYLRDEIARTGVVVVEAA